MANKPLKSIQFPGLSDTYTVPQVDASLATSGAAADAKKVGDEISDLKQDFNNTNNALKDGLLAFNPYAPFSGYSYIFSGGEITQTSYDQTYYTCPLMLNSDSVKFDFSNVTYRTIAVAWTPDSYQASIWVDLRANSYGKLLATYGSNSYAVAVLSSFPVFDLSNLYVVAYGNGVYKIYDDKNEYTFDVKTFNNLYNPNLSWAFDIGVEMSKDFSASPYLGKAYLNNDAIKVVNNINGYDNIDISDRLGISIENDLSWTNGYYDTTGSFVSSSYYMASELSDDIFSVSSKDGNVYFYIGAFDEQGAFIGYLSAYGVYVKNAITSESIKFVVAQVPQNNYQHFVVIAHFDNTTLSNHKGIEIISKYHPDYALVIDREGERIAVEPNAISGNIVYTIDNFCVKEVDGALYLSDDNGSTYGSGLDISSIADDRVVRMRLWKNGTFNIFTPTKVYYTDDWSTLTEADVYEEDGETEFIPEGIAAYTSPYFDDGRLIFDDVEVYLFGNTPYSSTTDGTDRVCLYYSCDNGHSYKIAYEFNTESTLQVRHTHFAKVIGNHYWVATGDLEQNCYLLEFDYDITNDTWSYNTIGSGINYKWVGCGVYGENLYYTYDNTPGKVMRCNIQDVSNVAKHECILNDLPNDPIGLFIGKHGDMLVTLMTARSGQTTSPFSAAADSKRMYYSKDRVLFTELRGFIPYGAPTGGDYYCFSGCNNNGKILAIVNQGGNWNDTDLLHNTVWLDDYVKQAGFLGAFRK